MQNEWYAPEREKERERERGVTQFKIKGGLELGEFARVAYPNFFKRVHWPNIKTPRTEKRTIAKDTIA